MLKSCVIIKIYNKNLIYIIFNIPAHATEHPTEFRDCFILRNDVQNEGTPKKKLEKLEDSKNHNLYKFHYLHNHIITLGLRVILPSFESRKCLVLLENFYKNSTFQC